MKPLILASGSPRRKELLALAGFSFQVVVPDCEENFSAQLAIPSVPEVLAKRKADAVQERFPNAVILAADTIVVCDSQILGKPVTKADAFHMLRFLSGKTHQVYTGVCLLAPDTPAVVFSQQTDVTFFPLTDNEIWSYIDTKEPMDKAGAYGIQGKGALLVKTVSGDFYNIVGLPIAPVTKLLRPMLNND